MKPRRTTKQRQIMAVILAALGEARLLTIEELRAALPYEVSYDALRVSLRFLEDRKMLLRERERGRIILRPTQEAMNWFRAGDV